MGNGNPALIRPVWLRSVPGRHGHVSREDGGNRRIPPGHRERLRQDGPLPSLQILLKERGDFVERDRVTAASVVQIGMRRSGYDQQFLVVAVDCV